jgi:hypothetical protein
MNGDQSRTRAVAAVLVVLGFLAGCSPAPVGIAPPATQPTSVTEAVRASTDRSTVQHDVVTLPSGERMIRMRSSTAFGHVVIGRVDAAGKRSVACVDNVPDAEAFLAGGPQGAAQ